MSKLQTLLSPLYVYLKQRKRATVYARICLFINLMVRLSWPSSLPIRRPISVLSCNHWLHLEHYAKSKELHDNILSIAISKFSFSYRSIRNSDFYVIIIAMRNIPSLNANMISCCLTIESLSMRLSIWCGLWKTFTAISRARWHQMERMPLLPQPPKCNVNRTWLDGNIGKTMRPSDTMLASPFRK